LKTKSRAQLVEFTDFEDNPPKSVLLSVAFTVKSDDVFAFAISIDSADRPPISVSLLEAYFSSSELQLSKDLLQQNLMIRLRNGWCERSLII
jgi:hypothetical protein